MRRTYPHGVPCWIDLQESDVDATRRFYGELFGWTFEDAVPPDAPGSYLIATLDGQDVAAVAPASADVTDPPTWATYVAVDDADATATLVAASGGTVVAPPQDAGPGGRAATCRDPGGATFGLWQPRRRLGAQLVNTPGTWNFSNLRTDDRTAAMAFYRPLFGWESGDMAGPTMLSVPGYGDHLASTSDPDIRVRQEFAPPGFADVVAGIEPVAAGEAPHWHVMFTIADRDETVATAERLGATVVSSTDTAWTREAMLRDPQGAVFTASQFAPGG